MKRITTYFAFLLAFTGLLACSGENNNRITLTVTPQTFAVDAVAANQTVSLTSNGAWTISNGANWSTVSPLAGNGNATIAVNLAANSNTSPRSTVIKVTAGDISKEITVNQAAASHQGSLSGNFAVPPDSSNIRDLTSVELSQLMGVGWNIGNSLDAIGGETAWGNPLINQQLINSIKAAGFKSIRLPVAWSRFSDESNFVIQASWMNRVETVVNSILAADMYVVMNIHWDNGWMQPTFAQADYVNFRLQVMWQQIAEHFRDYDDRLLFAGTNEVMVDGDYGTPTEEYYTVQNSFNKTFVETVRATGGRNAYRHLVVQGFNTNIDHTINFAQVPDDVVDNRLMMEVHYYDPYNFTLNSESSITQWGNIATNPAATETWANESYTDSQFQKMKTHFIDQGIAVILGEYGVISRTNVSGHETYRVYWNKYITESAVNHGLVPFYWDNGYTGNGGMSLFDRNTGAQLHPNIIQAIINAAQ